MTGPSSSASPARCAAVTRGNSRGAESTSPKAAAAGTVDRRRPRAERDDRHGPLVHPIGADERANVRVGEARVQPGSEPGGVRHGEELGEHRAGIPVDVPEPAFPVPPAGPPWDAGDRDRGRAHARWRSDPDEGVIGRVVPVDTRRHGRALGSGDVQLEGEATARRPGRAEQPGRVRPRHRSHHARGEVEQAGELRQVHLAGDGRRGAGKHRDGRGIRRRQTTGERQAGERRLVPLEEPREARQVVDLEVHQHARVDDGCRPAEVGIVVRAGVPVPRGRGQSMQRLRGRLQR